MKCNQVRLNCGTTIPIIGLGTYSFQNDREKTEEAVQMAVKMGYRHFDTAKIYGSEPALGKALTEAIRDQIVEREDIFVTSKLWGSDHHDPVSALKQTLQIYLSLVCLNDGKTYLKSLGDIILLFSRQKWDCVGASASAISLVGRLNGSWILLAVPPAVNQVEMHPMWRQAKLRELCGEQNIHVSAYSPLGGPGNSWGSTAVVENPIIQSIALKHKATPAQVSLGWGLLKGASVIVKSFNEDRMKENMGALDLRLDDRDLLDIAKMEERKIMSGEFLVNETTSPYKTLQDLWDDEI
ncbi:hypothetical protein F0562_031393 [Nyssa sinensis]|uniref:NADP-dependent oxidoreductase domain-containing protein n=1 Tax=Nyssa sinensis TaxID=561372 RepID=A0A5J5AVE7_9ASTE|nr:hypothetical protein F0562_031393 [Nyssa sinensis]